jgi:hypothetical protein
MHSSNFVCHLLSLWSSGSTPAGVQPKQLALQVVQQPLCHCISRVHRAIRQVRLDILPETNSALLVRVSEFRPWIETTNSVAQSNQPAQDLPLLRLNRLWRLTVVFAKSHNLSTKSVPNWLRN